MLFKLMNPIAFLLYAFTRLVMSQTSPVLSSDIFPARILVRHKTVRENSDLYVTCSTFGVKKEALGYVYLCKDGAGIKEAKQEEEHDTVFIIPRVRLHNSGSYSCVYSSKQYEPSTIAKLGTNSIHIQVIPNFLPADIFVAGSSTVSEGDDVQFRCTFSSTLETLGGCRLIQSYLRRNETVVRLQIFNVTKKEATFTIQGAVMRDSGTYNCVVLPTQCIDEQEEIVSGNNVALLEVKENLFVRVTVYFGAIGLMLLLGFCVWRFGIKGCMNAGKLRGHATLQNSGAASEQPDTHMLGEQQDQTQEHDLEAQDSGSFSTDEEEGYQNDELVEASTFPVNNNSDEEGVYSVADDRPATSASECTYARSFRHKIKFSPDFTTS